MTAGPGPRASPAALVGSTVGNSFTLDKLLAQGRHGALFDGRHSRLGQHYAVRVLALDSGRRAALLGALSQCGAVVHPNLTPVREVIALPDEQLALCTPLLPGLNLSQRVALQGKLTAAEGTVMMRQAASALHALHQRGLVHGGLSPENLFFTQHDDVAVDNALGSRKGGQLVQLLDAGLYVCTLQPGQSPLSAADDQLALGKLILAHVADLLPGQRRVLERTQEGRAESRYPSVRDLWQAFDAAKAVGKHGPTGSVATALVPKITLADLRGASRGRRTIVIAGSALLAACGGGDQQTAATTVPADGLDATLAHHAEAIGVTDHDLSGEPGAFREIGDALDLPDAELSRIVQMDVDVDTMPLRQAEDDACPHGPAHQPRQARAEDGGDRDLPRRFDVPFLVARMPDGQTPVADGAEQFEPVWVSPADALRRHAERLGYPKGFAIYDRGDQESTARAVLRGEWLLAGGSLGDGFQRDQGAHQ